MSIFHMINQILSEDEDALDDPELNPALGRMHIDDARLAWAKRSRIRRNYDVAFNFRDHMGRGLVLCSSRNLDDGPPLDVTVWLENRTGEEIPAIGAAQMGYQEHDPWALGLPYRPKYRLH